jgi:hypothetical protein
MVLTGVEAVRPGWLETEHALADALWTRDADRRTDPGMGLNVHVTLTMPGLRKGLRAIAEAIMTGKEALLAAIDRLTAAVDRLATGGVQTGGLTEQEANDTAAAVTAQAQRLEAIPSPGDGSGTATEAAARHK